MMRPDSQDRLIRRDDDTALTVTTWAPDGTPAVREYSPAEVAEAEARAAEAVDRGPQIAQGIAALRAEVDRLEQAASKVAGREIPPAVVQMCRQARALLIAASARLRRQA